jgi:transposase
MDSDALNAITDVSVLRALVTEKIAEIAQHVVSIEQQARIISARDEAIRFRDAKIDKLTHELARLRRLQFAACSERMDPGQRDLFDETLAADIAQLEAELGCLRENTASVLPTPRQPAIRRALPAELTRIETRHEPASCDCPQCGGKLVQIGEHVSEKLDCKPIEFFVRRDIYPQYACKPCQTVVAEPVAPAILDRSLAALGLLAQVVIQKYVDHLPLYRQEAIFARSGIELSRTTLAEWIGVVGLRLQPLVDAMKARLLTEPILHADETPVTQLDPGAGKTRRAYLFAYAAQGWASVASAGDGMDAGGRATQGAVAGCAGARRSTGEAPIIVFDYCTSRAGKHASTFLGEWTGALMVDDYAGYKHLFAQSITELGCWAHARRAFFDAHKASCSPLAEEALRRIAALYRIEEAARALDSTQRHAYRQCRAAPLLDGFKRWLDDRAPTVLGNSGLHRAIAYTRKRWPALTRYLDDGRYPIDNNPIENAIRPIALGRKNWLFAGSETAGQRVAAIMSLLATAKANGLEPHAWLTDVLTRLPTTKDRDIAALLPLVDPTTAAQGRVG